MQAQTEQRWLVESAIEQAPCEQTRAALYYLLHLTDLDRKDREAPMDRLARVRSGREDGHDC